LAAVVGAADHCGWAVLVAVAPDGTLIDRRRVDLVDGALPKLPHHHDAQGLPPPQGVALVERVRASALVCSSAALESLAATVPGKITGIALRRCPHLPPTVEERISNYRAQTMADGVMYREALAQAAKARGWVVHWYDAKGVLAEAARALRRKSLDPLFRKTGAAIGPPWQKDHQVAMAAAIAAAARKP
jgi:hypothetical protein